MEIEEKREQFKKKLRWGMGFLTVLLVMLLFDKQKVYKEEKPPMPIVSVGEQEIQPVLGTYKWHGEKVEKELTDLTGSLDYKNLEYRDKLTIDFPDDEQPIFVAKGNYHNNKLYVNPYSSHFGEDDYYLSNYSSIETPSLHAYWEGGKRAEYIIPLNIRQVNPEKEYLAHSRGYHSLLLIGDAESDGQSIIDELHEEYPAYLLETHGYIDTETANKHHSELNVEKDPSYILFDQEKEIFRTNTLEELKNYIKENSYVRKRTVEGIVTRIDREFRFIMVDDQPLSAEDVTSLRTGQKISLDVTDLNKEIPFYHKIENIKVLKEPDRTFLDKKWLSKERDKFSILAIGDSSFTKPFKSPHKADFKLADNITIQKSLKLDDGKAEPAIYVFNDKELLFQTRDYENVLQFLFEMEQLLPMKNEMKANDY
ncbi:hypothetical protein J7I93_24975 [Bacillus sp. ISL-47]|uniref:hypothetical protein n=1 Tax=Bacillus sp. ISL-47 TaxID=2819130 RepID=UPI001BED2B9A|nr:hypothetical protein [Bacillus sp. ISL-47]MBT2691380.1 hypothetical protein [Bacillus sp. ISL-47]MBT2711230.1 hypothetical protein [Pseudomonas sp. ISL-84]